MEQHLIALAQKGDQDAFQSLVELHTRRVWRTAWVLLGDRTRAEDAVQEAWLDVWQHLGQFDLAREFRPWLLTIVANRCRMLARHRALATIPIDEPSVAEQLALADVAEQYTRQESDAELYRALAALPTDQRQVVELRYFAELQPSEIAVVLGIPAGTVKSRLHRALDALRLRLPAASSWRNLL